MRAFKQATKCKSPGFSQSAIEHPDGPQWFIDQLYVAFKIAKNKLAPPALPLIPGLNRPRQYDFDLPTSGITDAEGKPIRKVVKNGKSATAGRYTDEIVEGFPPELNRPVSTPEEINQRRKERLKWVNENCVEIATSRGGKRSNEIQLRPKSGVAEQCFGNLDLRITLALRFAAKEGFDLESLYEGACRYGAKALQRFCGVIVLSQFVHPPNPFLFLSGKRHGRGPDLGFNLHLQYQTARGFGGAWLSEFTEYHPATPGVCAGINLIEMGVDIDAYSGATEKVKWQFLFKESDQKYWSKYNLAEATVAKIRRCRAAVKAGKTTFEAVIEKELAEWAEDLAKSKSKSMAGIYMRNLATASAHGQVPPDYLVGSLGSRYIRREGEKVVGAKWKKILERADRCAREIETRNFEKGFTVPLSHLLYEWEAGEEESARIRKYEADRAEQQHKIDAANDHVRELTESLEREKTERAASEKRYEEQRQEFEQQLWAAKAGSDEATELQSKITKLDSDRASENAVFEERVSTLDQQLNEANAIVAQARAELTAEKARSADLESKLESLERDRAASEKRYEDEKAALQQALSEAQSEGGENSKKVDELTEGMQSLEDLHAKDVAAFGAREKKLSDELSSLQADFAAKEKELAEANKNLERERAATQKKVAALAAPYFAHRVEWVKSVMRGDPPPEASPLGFFQKTDGLWLTVGGVEAAEAVLKVDLSKSFASDHVTAFKAAASEFLSLVKEQRAVLERYRQLASGGNMAGAGRLVEAEMTKWKQRFPVVAITRDQLVDEGLRIGKAQYHDLPRLKSLVETIEACHSGASAQLPAWAADYIDPNPRVTGCLSFRKRFVDELQSVKALVPKLAEDIERRAQAITARAELKYFSGGVEAVEQLLHKQELPESARVWFTSSGRLRFDLLAAARVAVRDGKGPLSEDPDVQIRAEAAGTLLRLANQHAVQRHIAGIQEPRTQDERAAIDAYMTTGAETGERSRVT